MTAELDNLATQADTLTAEVATTNAPPGPEAVPQAPPPSNADAVAALLGSARELLVHMLGIQSARATLADDKIRAAAGAIAPVLDKYGINLGGGIMGVEMAAVLTAGPILWAAYSATMAELLERKKAAQQQAAQSQANTSPTGVVPGAPVGRGVTVMDLANVRKMADAELVAALGSRGMGKSAWVKQRLAKMRPPRLAVWDLMREYPGEGSTDLGAVVRGMKGARWSVVFFPSGDAKVRARQFEIFCKALLASSTKARPVVAVVEELAFVTSPSWAPGAWQEVSLLGRHKGLSVIGTSQRPASVDKDFLGNCTLVHSARLGYEPDAKVVGKRLGVKPEDLLNLPQLHFLERGEMDTGAKKGVLKFGAKPAA